MPDHEIIPATTSPLRAEQAAPVPESQARALFRKQALDGQQRTFQGAYPTPYLFRKRPPG